VHLERDLVSEGHRGNVAKEELVGHEISVVAIMPERENEPGRMW
jgi:hypothetical protein